MFMPEGKATVLGTARLLLRAPPRACFAGGGAGGGEKHPEALSCCCPENLHLNLVSRCLSVKPAVSAILQNSRREGLVAKDKSERKDGAS